MKFINLLKKELAELINVQMFLGIFVTFIIFMLLGNVMEETIEEVTKASYSVNICDMDDSDASKELLSMLEESGAKIKSCKAPEDSDFAACLKGNKVDSMVIIPEGFGEAFENGEKPEVRSIERMKSASVVSGATGGNSSTLDIIEICLTNMFAEKKGVTAEQLGIINDPLSVSEITVVDDKSAEISSGAIIGKTMVTTMAIPIIVFVLIIMTSQGIISSVANEKIDKTLETLLASPVSRTAIITAKMLSAAIVALVNAVLYMVAFSMFIGGSTDPLKDELSGDVLEQAVSVNKAMAQLGLDLSIGDYVLIGLQLFLTIMICLSISLMLGALVNDSKTSQTIIMPIMMMAMIPYFVSMLSDVNTLPMAIRILMYAIPFTHTFSAMPNLMFGNTSIFIGGLIYQAVLFLICMFFALRLFKSDKILTISLNFGQKSKFKKRNKGAREDE